jgi:hypothetical protein
LAESDCEIENDEIQFQFLVSDWLEFSNKIVDYYLMKNCTKIHVSRNN